MHKIDPRLAITFGEDVVIINSTCLLKQEKLTPLQAQATHGLINTHCSIRGNKPSLMHNTLTELMYNRKMCR